MGAGSIRREAAIRSTIVSWFTRQTDAIRMTRMGIAETIAAWRDFYGAVANATAALLGLVFVGMSLHLTLRRAPTPVTSLALASAITLIQPLLVSFVMLIPTDAPTVHAAGCLIVAAVLVVELGVVLRIHRRSHTEAFGWLAYRFGIPLAAAAVLGAGAIGMLLGWPPAVWAPALFVFATVIVGVQDAWDLLIARAQGFSPDAEVTTTE